MAVSAARKFAHGRRIINPNIGLGNGFPLARLTIAFAVDFPITITATMAPSAIKIAPLRFERRQDDNRVAFSMMPVPRPALGRGNKQNEKARDTRG